MWPLVVERGPVRAQLRRCDVSLVSELEAHGVRGDGSGLQARGGRRRGGGADGLPTASGRRRRAWPADREQAAVAVSKQRDGVDASTPPKPGPRSRSATPPPVGASGGDAASTVGDGSTSTIAAALGGSRAWWPTRSSRRKGLLRDGGGGGVVATIEQRLVDRVPLGMSDC